MEFKSSSQHDSKAFPKWIQSYAALMETQCPQKANPIILFDI